MKRILMGLCVSLFLVTPPGGLLAQDAAAQAAAQAERQDREERYQRLNSAVEEIIAADAQQRKRLSDLAEEVRRLREDIARANQIFANCASVEDVKRLAKAVQEIEKNREQDKEMLKERLDDLRKIYKNPPVMPDSKPPVVEPPASEKSPDKSVEKTQGEMKGYEHVVQSGESLSIIVQAYRKQGVKVSMEQVIKANPGINPNRLLTGKKVFIPDASLK